jgi:hypothetical protein
VWFGATSRLFLPMTGVLSELFMRLALHIPSSVNRYCITRLFRDAVEVVQQVFTRRWRFATAYNTGGSPRFASRFAVREVYFTDRGALINGNHAMHNMKGTG